jgi:hypothetical protein
VGRVVPGPGVAGSGVDEYVVVNGIDETSAGTKTLTFVYLLNGSRMFSISVDGGPDIVENLSGTSFSTPVAASVPVTVQQV